MTASENLRRLLANLEPLRRWASLRAHSRAFNVFSILRAESDEVGLHTVFIGALIDPAGTHGCGATLLELFLAELGVCLPPDADLSGAIIERERRTSDSGQIDLLIELPRAGTVVIVENKIHAGDQDRQLERYYQRATKRAGPQVAHISSTSRCMAPSLPPRVSARWRSKGSCASATANTSYDGSRVAWRRPAATPYFVRRWPSMKN